MDLAFFYSEFKKRVVGVAAGDGVAEVAAEIPEIDIVEDLSNLNSETAKSVKKPFLYTMGAMGADTLKSGDTVLETVCEFSFFYMFKPSQGLVVLGVHDKINKILVDMQRHFQEVKQGQNNDIDNSFIVEEYANSDLGEYDVGVKVPDFFNMGRVTFKIRYNSHYS